MQQNALRESPAHFLISIPRKPELLLTNKFQLMKSIHRSYLHIMYLTVKSLSGYKLFVTCMLFLSACAISNAQVRSTPVRIIMIGAHPDDCDQKGGGTAALFASLG